ncbi:MAG: hypothetical protein OXL34_06310, partial [Gemmatimonadota bacterium]|nr:hypothetical protein [Gemmatimonadota bacterium]
MPGSAVLESPDRQPRPRKTTSARCFRGSRRSTWLAVTATLAACDTFPPPDDAFLTRAERTDYRETSSYADVVDFLE